MFLNKLKPDSIETSIPRPRRVRGYEIKRMPIGAYLQAMKEIQELPAKAIDALFPGMSIEDVLVTMKSCDTEVIGQLFMRALTMLPEEMITLLAVFTGIPRESLMDDATIGLDGLVEIMAAWMEVNDLENFIRAARSLWANVKGMAAAKTGSKG